MKLEVFAVAATFTMVCLSLGAWGAVDLTIEFNQPHGSGQKIEVPPLDASKSASDQMKKAPAKAPTRPLGKWAGNPTRFFEGAFVALLGHETGHLITNYAMDTDPYTKPVHYGPIPFFTIEPGRRLNPHEHYITASAGFNAQGLIDEWLLTSHPNLREEDKPFLKGMATFSFWLTVGYAATAFAGTGPNERDTKGMADALGWNERWVGAMILAPAVLDTYRYNHPDAKWARTASRLSKLIMIGLAANAH
ncbi:MAG: hypothetical protein M1133_14220 [Armatimonadetes bacterium]|nr:hypothetical protein [Armatimonadota bacterium]